MQINGNRVVLGNHERKADGVDIDASARYWYGVTLDWSDVVDYSGEIGVRVASEISPVRGVPGVQADRRARWAAARESGTVRALRSAQQCEQW